MLFNNQAEKCEFGYEFEMQFIASSFSSLKHQHSSCRQVIKWRFLYIVDITVDRLIKPLLK